VSVWLSAPSLFLNLNAVGRVVRRMLNVTRQKAERGQRLTLRSEIRRPTLVKRHDLSELKRRRVNIAYKAVTRGGGVLGV